MPVRIIKVPLLIQLVGGEQATAMVDTVTEGFNRFNYRAGREPHFTPHAGWLGLRHPVTISIIQNISHPILPRSRCLCSAFTTPSLPPLCRSLSPSLFFRSLCFSGCWSFCVVRNQSALTDVVIGDSRQCWRKGRKLILQQKKTMQISTNQVFFFTHHFFSDARNIRGKTWSDGAVKEY